MHVLVTGMTSSQTHESQKRGGLTVAGSIARGLRLAGHTVDTRPYTIDESLAGVGTDDYEMVFIGLGPLKGLATSYMYGAIQAINDSFHKQVLYFDDTATKKIGNEFRAVLAKPSDYTKPFWTYKRGWNYVGSDPDPQENPVLAGHLYTISMLAGRLDSPYYPPVLVPSWEFDLGYTAANMICQKAADQTVVFDPSIFFGEDLIKLDNDLADERSPYTWGCTWGGDHPAVQKMGSLTWDVNLIPRGSWEVLQMSDGILVPHASWAPEVSLASRIGIPVAADWRTLGPVFGPSLEALPANIEIMSDAERKELAAAQAKALVTDKSSVQGVTQILHETAKKASAR